MMTMEVALTRLLATTDATYYRDARRRQVPVLPTGSSERQFVGARSKVVLLDGRYDAVAAFPWAPDGLPIKIYEYSSNRSWNTVAALKSPFGFSKGAMYLASATIPVASLSGLSDPAFLIREVGGGCFQGAVVAFVGGQWTLLSASNAADQESPEIGGDPSFRHGYLFTTTVCGAVPAYTGDTVAWWKVNPSAGDFVMVRQEVISTDKKASSDS
ncbi:hypothetical protein [Ferrimicrobium sp.]|uniref:hypothetical protein n=1 Tax=Ferrimicrobium sp. TaxID=2926050 RepID=UPI0026379A55|nr:hypothetical protein [Ferrimicrobium sp.]